MPGVTLAIGQVEPGILRLAMSTWRGRAVGYTASAYMLRGVLIDAGFPNARDDVVEAARSLEPRGCIVTHSHEDHSGNAAQLAAMGIPLLMHADCERVLRERPPIGMYRQFVWGRAARLSVPITPFDPAPLEVIATPGHTSDHIVVWDAERRVVVSGDLFLGVKVRVAHLHESPSRVLCSLRRVAALKPRLLLDGHRGPVADATVLLGAKIAWMEEISGAIAALATQGVGEGEIQRRVLGREAFVGRVSFGEYSKRAFVKAVTHEARQLNRI